MEKMIRNEIVQNYSLSLIYIADAIAIYFNSKTYMYCLTGAIIILQLLSLIFPPVELPHQDEVVRKKIKMSKQIHRVGLIILAIAFFYS